MGLFSRWFGKGLKDPGQAASVAVSALKEAAGADLISVMLYGSAAAGDSSKDSDLNLLVVTKRLDAATLAKLQPATAKWAGGSIKPMFFAIQELKASADVFPIEFLDIQDNRKVLHGEDPFSRMVIDKRNLRHQLEYEVKTKAIAFRQRYLAGENKGKALRRMIGELSAALLPVFRALLKLKRNRPARQRVKVIEDVCRYFRLHRKTFLQAHDIKYRGMEMAESAGQELFEKMLGELERLGESVDRVPLEQISDNRPEGRSDERRPRRDSRDRGRQGRDRDRGTPQPGREKVAAVKQLLADLNNKKRWEPKEGERFSSDAMARDAAQPLDVRFGWDRAWVRFKSGQGEAPITETPLMADPAEDDTPDEAIGNVIEGKSKVERLPEEKLSGPAAEEKKEAEEKTASEENKIEAVEEAPEVNGKESAAVADEAAADKSEEERPAPRPAAERHLGKLDEKNRAVPGPPLERKSSPAGESEEAAAAPVAEDSVDKLPEEKFYR